MMGQNRLDLQARPVLQVLIHSTPEYHEQATRPRERCTR